MRWRLHIGTEKTGSSYLQSTLAVSRHQIEKHQIAFPIGWAHDERSMRTGAISAGNARRLATAIMLFDETLARRELRSSKLYATRKGATQVLLTSEWLLSALAVDGRLRWLIAQVLAEGASGVDMLLILRSPVAQCLSLFKHRAKRGSVGDIAEWVKTGYILPSELASFRRQAEELEIALCVRAYDRTPGMLERTFFTEWLGVEPPGVSVPSIVNPSLTLSELALIRQLAALQPALVEPLYEELLRVDPAEKVESSALEAYSRAVASEAVSRHHEEWVRWNALLPEDERLEIPAAPDSIPLRPTELALSEAQINAVAAVLSQAASIRFIAQLFWRSRLRPLLGRIKRGFGF